jgi:hypothetical protein
MPKSLWRRGESFRLKLEAAGKRNDEAARERTTTGVKALRLEKPEP